MVPMADLKELFEMVTQQAEPDQASWRDQERRQRKTARNRKVGAIVVAAAIVVGAVLIFLDTRPSEDGGIPADTSLSTDTPTKIASAFVNAYGTFDVAASMAYLADDADITGMINSVGARGVDGTPASLPALISWMEADGYRQQINSLAPCEELGRSASGTSVRCAFVFDSLRSDEIGVGPFGGSFFDLTVRDGEIVRASIYFETAAFSPQMWEPFAEWVSATYPADAAVMYENEARTGARLTEESIRLWERHTKDYVKVATPDALAIAKRFMTARNSYDTQTAMSLVVDGPVTAQLMHDNRMNSDMFSVQLNRDELALAFEAERLFGVRYESFECRRGDFRLGGDGSSANVICTYSMDSRMRQLAGSPPLKSAFGIGVHGSRIDVVTFPWLNISWNPSGYYPPEFRQFVLWLDAAHPEASDAEDPMAPQRLFRTAGQEWILKLDRGSINLLADYLEEYERFARR
jgi:hypothetical protein